MTDLLNSPLWVLITASALAVLFAHAALLKASDRELLIHHLAGYGIPVDARNGVAHAVIALEGMTAASLLSPWRSPGAYLAVAMLGIYALAMALQLMQRRVIDCGCGGQALPVSWVLVVRNGLLMMLAWMASQSADMRDLAWIDFWVVMAAVLLMVVLYTAIHQVLMQQAMLRQRLYSGSL
jgi:hypothetical protein